MRSESSAPSGANVLTQLDPDATEERFPIAVLDTPILRNVRVSVRCKIVAGVVDQACGLVARYRDTDNYYITRANALENNVRLYFVRDGRRELMANWNGPVASNVWHAFQFEIEDDRLKVTWDGLLVIDHHDRVHSEAGRVGVWTKSVSIAYYDDLTVGAQRER